MTIKLICVDADDTLWHNMRHFNATEDALIDMLRPFAETDITRERLIACETRNLPLYGYGAKGFTLSMIETAVELAGESLSTATIEGILAAGRALLAHPVTCSTAWNTRCGRWRRSGRWCWSPRATCCIRKANWPHRGWATCFRV